eukprot:CAMPEP_0119485422 /NCGR_PEP_ID=MMETSP1344-20130328/12134_1 /TAXON_ID=236787 /ORGANISM="Florenciella parvula, Strain CCMP2471" /LENGTH=42 /DNA_ID= /DNA_START= /DNA_END= /DNA_ORIENTATION=
MTARDLPDLRGAAIALRPGDLQPIALPAPGEEAAEFRALLLL